MGDFKKKHGQSRVATFLQKVGKSELIERVANAAGDVITGDTLGAIKTLITGDKDLTPQDKETALELLKLDKIELEEVTKRWTSDNVSDSWWSKNIRPLTLASLLCSFFCFCFLDSIGNLDVKDQWINLQENILFIVVVSYFGSRGVEKFQKIKRF